MAGPSLHPIRVLIVDDSALARDLIRYALEQDPDITVVGEAADGRQAVAQALALTPHLITMDLEMPVMDGFAAIEEIMHLHAVPILVVSGRADASNAYLAISRGALEVLPKPDFTAQDAASFAAKVKLLAGIRVIRHLRRHQPAAPVAALPTAPRAAAAPVASALEVVAIASSTGGPQAIAAILLRLPAAFPAPILIAQHIADGFAGDMARWLDGLTPLHVALATDGAELRPGQVYLAPSESHLEVGADRRLHLLPRGASDVYRPSCDRLLASVARVYGRRALGVILTGMGHDGVAGMGAIRAAGGATLAQDEASSVIYGMNGCAVDAGAVARALPLDALAGSIQALAQGTGG